MSTDPLTHLEKEKPSFGLLTAQKWPAPPDPSPLLWVLPDGYRVLTVDLLHSFNVGIKLWVPIQVSCTAPLSQQKWQGEGRKMEETREVKNTQNTRKPQDQENPTIAGHVSQRLCRKGLLGMALAGISVTATSPSVTTHKFQGSPCRLCLRSSHR